MKAGYAGTVWAGYRGALPPWVVQLKRIDGETDAFWVADKVRLVFVKLDISIHLTNYKPEFMLNLLSNQACDCEYLWYFDPDIFLRASWSFFADWQSNGIALCQEIANNILPPDAPLRQSWVRAAASIGYTNPHPLYHYYNGGLAGVPREYSDFLTTWKDMIELAGSKYCDLGEFNQRNPETPFNSCDQDCLNVAAMYSKFPLSTLGPQAMGFTADNQGISAKIGLEKARFDILCAVIAKFRSHLFFLRGNHRYKPIFVGKTEPSACAVCSYLLVSTSFLYLYSSSVPPRTPRPPSWTTKCRCPERPGAQSFRRGKALWARRSY